MAKAVKRGKAEIEAIKEEDDKTIIYMIVGFCVGAIVALIFFEYYWVGVGGGAGMLLGILISTVVDYKKAKAAPKVSPAKKTPAKKNKKAVK